MTTAADIIAEALYAAGVRHAFGIPGGEVLALVDALERAGIRFVIARHENAAGFMAEGAYRATGAPGVLVATVGPGLANGVNSIANAQQERVPLIVFSGQVPEAETLKYNHQIFDHAAVMKPFVKAGFEAREGACDVMIDKALHIAMAPQRGPVHIDLPIPVAKSDHAPHKGRAPAKGAALTPSDGPDAERARAMFTNAKRPIIMVGQDILDEPEGPVTLRKFAQTHRIPVVTTYKAKGVLPEDDALCLGGHGLSPKSDAIILPLVAKADLVITAGYDPIEMRSGWIEPFDPARVVAFSPVLNDHFVHREETWFQCAVTTGLSLFDGLSPAAVWADGDIPETRAALEAAFKPSENWGPATVFDMVGKVFTPDTHMTVDSGAHRILFSQMHRCGAPGTLMQSTGLCTMGCGLPMASGYAMASGRSVVAVMGDGCLDMILGELATLRENALDVTVLVLVDGSYALIAQKQYAEGYQSAGVDFAETDYAAVAAAMNIPSHRAADAETLEAALVQARDTKGPRLVAAHIPRSAYRGLI